MDVLSYDAYMKQRKRLHPDKRPLPREVVERVSETVITWWENRHYVMKWQFNWRCLYRHSISDFVAEDDGEREGDEDAAAQELATQEEEEGDAWQEPATAENTPKEAASRLAPVAAAAAGQPLSQLMQCSSYAQWHAELTRGVAPTVLNASKEAQGFIQGLAEFRADREQNWAKRVHLFL